MGGVLQLAWLNGLTEFIMPYMVQTIKEMTGKVRHSASDLHPVLSHRLLIQHTASAVMSCTLSARPVTLLPEQVQHPSASLTALHA